MKSDIKKVVVLGAGTMGAQLAAHLVAQGLEVALLDITTDGKATPATPLSPSSGGGGLSQPTPLSPSGERGGGEGSSSSRSSRSALALKALSTLKKAKPSPLHLPEHAEQIRPGNFDDDWKELKDADWVLEAIVEDLAIKRALFAKVAAAVKPTALVTSNTSGLSIAAMAAELPEPLRRRFFGTHFFNPPRYLKLLETIPGPDTDPETLEAFERFAEARLGKGVVRCKDTPNFIGNRVGAYAIGAAVHAMVELDLTIEEVDTLTGPAIGRPKSATFRTADIAGIDVVAKVSANLYEAVPNDPERKVFLLPGFVGKLLEKRWLGEKTGGGFYRKEGKDIRTLDWKSLEYRERQKASLPSVEAARSVDDPAARMRQILAGKDKDGRGAQFLWRVLSASCLYAAALVPEISDDVVAVDRAMEWGYGWGHGPFRLLDALGVEDVAKRAKAEGRTLPPLLEKLLASGRKRFYEAKDGRETVFGPAGVAPVAAREGVLVLAAVKAQGGLVKKNAGASLLDLGDGVALVEFHSKLNALGADGIGMLQTAVKEARGRFDALVIGNQGEHFSAGANLMLVLLAVQEEEWDELDLMIRQFQSANMALKYAELPVVVAPFGLTLGGGCEIALHGTRVCASAETYMGLVEVGVGVVPGAGGCKELALRALDRCAGVADADAFPFVKHAFERIAFAKVSTSGAEAKRMFLTEADQVSPNPDRLIHDAKQLALGLARAGHRPARPRSDLEVLGRPALATFKMGIHNALRAGQISEHDALVGTHVATVLVGGDRAPGVASEQHFLDLEREAFLSLLGTPKTQARIQHMLKEGKPLRN